MLESLETIAQAKSWNIRVAESGWEALERVQSGERPSLVLLDLGRQDADSLHTLRWLRRIRPEMPILVVADFSDMQHKTEAIRLGAQEYLVRPLHGPQIVAAISRHLTLEHETDDVPTGHQEIEEIDEGRFFIAASAAMRRLRVQAGLLAQINAPLLVLGEKGSGKDVVSRLVHKLSLRSGFPFLKIACGALSADLLENELFGGDHGHPHANGHRSRPGKIDSCEQGTILLDEITEMPLELQSRLLRLFEEKQSAARGGNGAKAEARIIANTCANPEQAMAQGTLRQDLYYRLSSFTIHVPPLRQRASEVPLLLGHFMSQLARHYGLEARPFSAELLRQCQLYPWPGNLTQMESFVKRYLVTRDEEAAIGELQNHHETLLEPPAERHGIPPAHSFPAARQYSGLKSLVQSVKGEAERNAILSALEQTHWNRRAAARLLKVSYRTLLYKIQQYNMSPAGYLSQYGVTLE